MTLIAGLEVDDKSYLLCDSIITDSSDVRYVNSKMKSYFCTKYGVVVAGDLAYAQRVLCFAANSKSAITKLKTDIDVIHFATALIESIGEDVLFDSIWRMPNGGVYAIDCHGCAVRAPFNLLTGGNVASFMKGSYQALSKYANGMTAERRIRSAAEATLECSEGAAHPLVIKTWKN